MTDLTLAFRMLLRQPGFTAVALLTLALSIGATTAIFSVVNGIVLRPLPFAESERLVLISEKNEQRGWMTFSVAPANYVDWARSSRTFESMVALTAGSVALRADDGRRAAAGHVRHRGTVSGPPGHARARPHLRHGRRCARRDAGGGDRPRSLAAAVRRGCGRGRPRRHHQRSPGDRRRRHEARVRRGAARHRRVAAAHHRSRARGARRPLAVGDRPSGAWRDTRAGAHRARDDRRDAGHTVPERKRRMGHDAGRPRASRRQRGREARPLPPPRRGRLRAPHRLRQRRQSAFGARHLAAA